MSHQQDDRDAVLLAFAESICAKAQVLKRMTLDPTHRARVREAVSDDLKKVSNLLVPEVSRAALDEASGLGVDLFEMSWHDQPGFDAGREIFHLEHVRPVSSLREACLLASSSDAIVRVLRTEMRVAWILKAEDDELTRLGYRTKRPNPDDACREAKIELLTRDAVHGLLGRGADQ